MNRIRTLDRLILLVLGPVWVCAFLAFAREIVRGGPFAPPFLVFGAADEHGFPVYVRARAGGEAAARALREGDRILSIGGADARGAGAFEAHARALAAAQAGGSIPLVVERAGRALAVEMRLVRPPAPWRMIPAALAFAIASVLVILQAPRSRLAQSFLLAGLVTSFAWLQFYGGSYVQSLLYFWSRTLVGYVWAPLALRPLLRLPGLPASRRSEVLLWVFALLGPTWTSMWFGFPLSFEAGARANAALGAALICTCLVLIARRYAAASALVRRQLRWLLLGIYVAGLPILVMSVLSAVRPELAWLTDLSRAGLVLIPICAFIAVTREGLLDVDRLITLAASGTLLVALVLASALTFAPRLAALVGGPSGSADSIVQAAVTATLAVILLQLDRRIRPRLEQRWRGTPAIERQLEALKQEYAALPNALALLRRTGDCVHDALALESCAVLACAGDSLSPVLRRGNCIAPSFTRNSELMRTLASQPNALHLSAATPRVLRALGASEPERAALAGSGAAVLLPIARAGELLALLMLGPKRSGDIFTPHELAQLAILAPTVAGELGRLGGLELLREAQELQRRMRQYVPGSVARQLQASTEIEPEAREVSVLFVDIEGYTRLTEQLPPDAVFSLVNRYTETVSDIVIRHGGSVVEFNGDGMMAVFGAPDALPTKERAAVEAARELVERVAHLDPGVAGTPLRAGVGVATGTAYVGSIRSVDRFIWSAIGRTTNLAARLQQLTRELGASIAIDHATREAAGDAAGGFVARAGVVVRGFRDEQNLYLFSLRLPAS